ncbi:MAG: retroviral-like aspartic protease family protein [Candidatus Aenigmarchaeota archaeon]|nr:retroviral-like aspartic protease family protein [Candidatus Aenigmarchaeota archaeon]
MQIKYMEKQIVGPLERVKIIGEKRSVETLAKFDTGASNNSIDYKIAATAGVGPIISSVKIKNAFTKNKIVRRPVTRMRMEIRNIKFNTKANLEDRLKRNVHVLIGRNIIRKHFIIDVSGRYKRLPKISLHETVTLKAIKEKTLKAKIDTGAEITSIDSSLAKQIGVEITGIKKISSSSGSKKRRIGYLDLKIKGMIIKNVKCNIVNRSHMKYAILIGKNVLKDNFLVDLESGK